MRVRVLRAFLFEGKAQEKGKEVDVPVVLGRDLISAQKAERVEELPPAPGPMTTEQAPELVGKPRKTKEKADV